MAPEGDVGGGGAAVVDAAPAVDSTPTDLGAPAVADAAPVVDAAPVDPNDPMTALEAAMKLEFPDAEPVAADPNAPPAQDASEVPEAYKGLMEISPFVQSPENLQQAVRAADEIWKVASGQAPASSLLEGIRPNTQVFNAAVNDLIPYLEQVTGRKFTDQPSTPPDPNQARLDAIEQRFAQEEQTRQTQQWNQQVTSARTKAVEFIDSKAKGTAFEGMTDTLLNLAGAKAGIPQEKMVEALLSGKTDKLEAAYKAATAELSGLVKQINANLIKKQRALANAVPGVNRGGAPQGNRNASSGFDAYLPGETPVQYATRQFKKSQ